MHLIPWSHRASAVGTTLRGWHTPPTGKPVLHFLHGNGLCGRTYDPMLASLAADFDLWLCDLPGHGDSDVPEHFAGWNRNAAAALEVFQAQRARFGDVPAYAMGHSFGGVLSTLIAAMPDQPFAKFVLLDPVIFPPAMLFAMHALARVGLARHNPLAKGAARRRSRWPDREGAFAALHGRGAYRGWTDEALRAFIVHGLRDVDDGVGLKCEPWLESEIFGSGPQRLWPSVRAVAAPTLLLHGEDSFPFVARSARRAARLNPHLRAQRVPGGHCFMQEDPAGAAARVRAFLAAPA